MQRLVAFLVGGALSLFAVQRAGAVCLGGAPNGVVTPAEACDDGNATNGDGCSSTCDIETEYSCTRAVSFANLNVQNFAGSTAVWQVSPDNRSGLQTQNTQIGRASCRERVS
jgi:cysteine-rich repeat protein